MLKYEFLSFLSRGSFLIYNLFSYVSHLVTLSNAQHKLIIAANSVIFNYAFMPLVLNANQERLFARTDPSTYVRIIVLDKNPASRLDIILIEFLMSSLITYCFVARTRCGYNSRHHNGGLAGYRRRCWLPAPSVSTTFMQYPFLPPY